MSSNHPKIENKHTQKHASRENSSRNKVLVSTRMIREKTARQKRDTLIMISRTFNVHCAFDIVLKPRSALKCF